MPRSKNQKHHHWRPDPSGNWDIDDPHKFLAKDGGARVAVRAYMEQEGIPQPQAVAEMLMFAYAHIVSSAPLEKGGNAASEGGLEQPQAADEQLTVSDASIQGPAKTSSARRKPRKNQASGSENIG